MNTEDHEVVFHLRDEIGIIKPELHGHFLEHLGSATYGGIWVGKDPSIPNINGIRKQAVEYLKELGVSVLRWPGGCFADDYHWRDGIGPQGNRPRRVNIWWGNCIEDNGFGTHEFMELCTLLNAQPYLAGNVGSGSPREFRDWIEYCNQGSGSTLSDERRTNGALEPFRVKYWGVGNESWACGGHMTPEEYAALYVRFATYLRAYDGLDPYLIAVGPEGNNQAWSNRFFAALHNRQFPLLPNGFAMHYYSWGQSTSISYTIETLQDQLATFASMEKAIQEQRAILDRHSQEDGKNCHIDLLVDEWGTWDIANPQNEEEHGRLWQQNTMKDALAAALGMNVFHRNADSLSMCNLAQLTNVLQTPLITQGHHCVRTPTYYAFKMCGLHKGNMSFQVERNTDETCFSVSASRSEESVAITLVNTKHNASMNVRCIFHKARLNRAVATLLHHSDFNACNTFEHPDVITPQHHPTAIDDAGCAVHMPPLSIVTINARVLQQDE